MLIFQFSKMLNKISNQITSLLLLLKLGINYHQLRLKEKPLAFCHSSGYKKSNLHSQKKKKDTVYAYEKEYFI